MNEKMFQKIEMAASVSNGVCTVCHHDSMFVSLTPDTYRCVTCGVDCHQYINGKIAYIPITNSKKIYITVDV